MAPRAMPSNAVVALRVMGGDPMPTGGAMMNTRRRWHFCHRRWWRRHVCRRRRGSSLLWRRRRSLLRARGQADDRQSSKCIENRGFHGNQSLTRRKKRKRSGFDSADSPFTPWLNVCRVSTSLWLPKKRTLRHVRHRRPWPLLARSRWLAACLMCAVMRHPFQPRRGQQCVWKAGPQLAIRGSLPAAASSTAHERQRRLLMRTKTDGVLCSCSSAGRS
jgi:hypothetical protein